MKKIFEIAKKILKWIWRIALILFLILFIYLQTPLKLLILTAIFVLESIFLPWRWGKWFWATVGIVILVLIIWIFLPENDAGWKPYAFDDELAALEAKNRIPDSENAAVIYNQLLADYNENTFEPNCLENRDFDNKTLDDYWHSKDYPEVAEWIKSKKDLINKLMQASQFERCKFAVSSKSWFQDVKRLGVFRRWLFLLARAGNNDIAEGRIDKGLKKYDCILQMGNHLCQQSYLVEMLVGMAIKQLSISRLEYYAINGNPDKKRLNEIEEKINNVKYDWQGDWPRVLDYEKMCFKNFIGIFYEINDKKQYRFSRRPDNAIKLFSPEVDIPPQTYLQTKIYKAYGILCWFFVPAKPQVLSKAVDAAYQKFYAMADPNFDWSKKPPDINFSLYVKNSLSCIRLNYKYLINMETSITESIYYNIHDLYLRAESEKKGALLLIALKRYKDKYGVWPESLDEIQDLTKAENFIDTANGKFFVYKLTKDGFTLYSKGKNGIDDGGRKWGSIDDKHDDINIWPLKSGKKESKTVKTEEPNNIQKDSNS